MNIPESIWREIIMFFSGAIILPFFLVYGCLLFFMFFRLVLPKTLWLWILDEYDVEQVSIDSRYRPVLVGFLWGLYIGIFLIANLFSDKDMSLLSRMVMNAGLIVGIIVTYKILKMIGI